MKIDEIAVIVFIYLLIIVVGHIGPFFNKTTPYPPKTHESSRTANFRLLDPTCRTAEAQAVPKPNGENSQNASNASKG